MKIKSIKISNILSYKYLDDFENAPSTLDFDNKNDLQILVGPNGSGKSNLIEILNQIFKKTLFKTCNFSGETFNNKDLEENKYKNTLTTNDKNSQLTNLDKNWNSNAEEQKISIYISFNENDYSNMKFVLKNKKEIISIFKKYSQINFSSLDGKKISLNNIKGIKQINLLFTRNNTSIKSFEVKINKKKPPNYLTFLKEYLIYFEYIQEAIKIYNKENKNNQWPPLKNTFALIGCYRNYNTITDSYSTYSDNHQQSQSAKEANLSTKKQSQNTLISENNEPFVFELVKHKLSYYGEHLLDSGKYGSDKIIEKIEKSDLFKKINQLMIKFINIELKINYINRSKTYKFSFLDKKHHNKQVIFNNLSAGQKGIIHLIFSLYGYDIKNGLLVIDEPELHLHPQFQKIYLDTLQTEAKKQKIQSIIATHSPIFVTEQTITGVKRFYFDDNELTTKIVSPKIEAGDKFLTQILHYTNTAKIFFVNKVILVEGESDKYFFEFYIDYFKSKLAKSKNLSESNKNKIGNFELIDIKGKTTFNNWRSFLEKWELKICFICDWDNVSDFRLLSKDRLEQLTQECLPECYRKLNKNIKDKKSTDGKALLENLINYLDTKNDQCFCKLKELTASLLKKHSPYKKIIGLLDKKEKQEVNEKIETKYKENIFILKDGELEDYLNIKKGLDNVIMFCNKFSTFTFDKNKQKELDDIIKLIFDIENEPEK